MGYEPTLIIRKSDLELNRAKIEAVMWEEKDEDKREDHSHLAHALNMQTIKFPEIEFVIIKVELTSSNKRVRVALDKLKIDYREFNG
mgnify:CR=1 FL=1